MASAGMGGGTVMVDGSDHSINHNQAAITGFGSSIDPYAHMYGSMHSVYGN